MGEQGLAPLRGSQQDLAGPSGPSLGWGDRVDRRVFPHAADYRPKVWSGYAAGRFDPDPSRSVPSEEQP